MGKKRNHGKITELYWKKEERKEDFQNFYKSYHIEPAPAEWRCSSCDKLYYYKYYSEESDEYYYKRCSNDKVHEEEWKEAAKVDLRRDIVKGFKKQEMVSKNCNKTGYKIARKSPMDECYDDFCLSVK